MKNTKQETRKEPKRIFGRQLALEMTPEDLEKAHSGAMPTFTLRFPPDSD